MPTAFAEHIKTIAGREMGLFPFAAGEALGTPTTITTGKIGNVSTHKLWEDPDVAAIIERHPAAIINNMTVQITAGQGVYGRAVTLHTGWGYDGQKVPTTHAEFMRLKNYSVRTCGGASDPSAFMHTLTAPFNEARSDVLKCSHFSVGGRIVLHYFFTESDFGSTQIKGDRFLFVISGELTTYGIN